MSAESAITRLSLTRRQSDYSFHSYLLFRLPPATMVSICMPVIIFDSQISPQLIRVRSKDGNFRIELAPESDISQFLAKVRATYEHLLSEITSNTDS